MCYNFVVSFNRSLLMISTRHLDVNRVILKEYELSRAPSRLIFSVRSHAHDNSRHRQRRDADENDGEHEFRYSPRRRGICYVRYRRPNRQTRLVAVPLQPRRRRSVIVVRHVETSHATRRGLENVAPVIRPRNVTAEGISAHIQLIQCPRGRRRVA